MSEDKPPYPDFVEVVRSPDFCGVAWIPTIVLRWVGRQDYPDTPSYRVLQQMWETHVINNPGYTIQVHNPNLTQWRDIPFVEDESDTLMPGEPPPDPAAKPEPPERPVPSET